MARLATRTDAIAASEALGAVAYVECSAKMLRGYKHLFDLVVDPEVCSKRARKMRGSGGRMKVFLDEINGQDSRVEGSEGRAST